MSPEYGATCGFFPVDEETLELPAPDRPRRGAGRPRRGLLQGEPALARPGEAPTYSQVVELDLPTVEPSLAGPRRPQDRVPLRAAKKSFVEALGTFGVDATTNGSPTRRSRTPSRPATRRPSRHPAAQPSRSRRDAGRRAPSPAASASRSTATDYRARARRVVIAAITSCTNTSNPPVMVAAGLLAKKAVERGLDASRG